MTLEPRLSDLRSPALLHPTRLRRAGNSCARRTHAAAAIVVLDWSLAARGIESSDDFPRAVREWLSDYPGHSRVRLGRRKSPEA